MHGTYQGVDSENVTPVIELMVGEVRGKTSGVVGTSDDCCVRGKLSASL